MGCAAVYFIHHPRTGGVYLNRLLSVNGIYISGGHNATVETGQKTRVVTVTVLRNPVERIQSLLQFLKRPDLKDKIPKAVLKVLGDSKWSGVQDCQSPELSNGMVRRLSGMDRADDEALELAKQALHQIDVVGLTEQHDVLIDRIAFATGLTLTQEAGHTRNESAPIDWTQDDLKYLQDTNEYDVKLYQYAIDQGLHLKRKKCNCRAKLRRWVQGAMGVAQSAAGLGYASDDVIRQRRAECRKCDFKIPCDDQPERVCGCRLCDCNLKKKTRLKGQFCPIGNW